MKIKAIPVFSVLLSILGLLLLSLGAQAAPDFQTGYSTPTPGPDGKIIYIVQEGDTCLRIQLLTFVPVAEIIRYNKLDEVCTISPGQQLIIGFGGPALTTPTSGPSPTPTIPPPSPTPDIGGLAEVCVALYDDSNGDGLRQSNTDALDAYVAEGTEPTVAGGAISLTSLSGLYSQTLPTVAGLDPVCFTDVPPGNYSVSAAVPDGYNPTTQLSYQMDVFAGDISQISFGIQEKTLALDASAPGRTNSPLLGVGGALFILGGLGLGFFAWRSKLQKKN